MVGFLILQSLQGAVYGIQGGWSYGFWRSIVLSAIKIVGKGHTARASNLRQDLITAKVSCGISKQSDWSIMMS